MPQTRSGLAVLLAVVLHEPGAVGAHPNIDQLSRKMKADCMHRRVPARRGRKGLGAAATALGFNFTAGESRPRGGWWYEQEDEYVFTNFFSASGRPPLKKRGTFLECGAHDGVSGSNTLWFERALQWSGVLVEGTPLVFKALARSRGGNPKNTLVNAVVCEEGQRVTYHVPLGQSAELGGAVTSAVVAGIGSSLPERNKVWLPTSMQVTCKPLGGVLREAAVSRVDFFSLDVEGAELAVLQTLDRAAAPSMFGLIMIEQDGRNDTKDRAVRALMVSWGFRLRGRTGQWCSNELYTRDD